MQQRFIDLLARTSRTFLLPILRAPAPLDDAVGAGYLCMRAIDEIEDHEKFPPEVKIRLLQGVADMLRDALANDAAVDRQALDALFRPYASDLDDVTLALADIAEAAPPATRAAVWSSTADMAEEMAHWVEVNWAIRDEADLDAYTFTVAGRVGLMLSDLFSWFDGTRCDREESIAFGRALQAVNIVRNRDEDRQRGVDFYLPGWTREDMIEYARRQIASADSFMGKLDPGPVYDFCMVPLALAKATLNAIASGREKLSRREVEQLVASLENQ